ncbi:hypothetical protein [Streptomyces beijiangensis]|uniref:DUF4232 domain-containing protein n=1 Tax=Streptomyces beijiangensis TaxID=163361 RepID=A0A939FBS7_9ACTN|nr:hypothetical protein [Streptomyces beijiangensis]MBO0515707.1 hypothetical protein [Streptomyces beijiangensis]
MSNDGPDKVVSGLDTDELALRRLMRSAVQELEPSEDALDHLHRAIPARRARKRQAVVGACAAALLVGTAVPAFIHVANSGSSSQNKPAVAGRQQAQGGTGEQTGSRTTEPGADSRAGSATDPGTADGETGTGADPDKAPHGTAAGGAGTDTPSSSLQDLPACDPSQLGVTSQKAGSPDPSGKVYGTFRISNISGTQCAVSDAGKVEFHVQGAADRSKIKVVEHTSGDAATGLPDPSQETSAVALAPAQAYEVKFAWVPTDTCPATNPSPDPTPSATATGATDAGTSTGNEAPSGTGTQLSSDGGASDGSVAVVHTAEPGAPTAEATIPNACAGTIYRTGVLDASGS